MIPICDLHCDLLLYLAEEKSTTPFDTRCPCSVDKLLNGNVKVQVLAIYTETGASSVQMAEIEVEKLRILLNDHPDKVRLVNSSDNLAFTGTENICSVILAIENASGFFGETEDLNIGFRRIENLIKQNFRPFYIGITWNGQNRFGGGIGAHIGLTNDGEQLLSFLKDKNIYIDISHSCDELVEDILKVTGKGNSQLKIISSHTNLRSVKNVPRNMPDHVAKEIIDRGGILGINVLVDFLGENSISPFVKNIEKILSFGGEKAIALGADFYFTEEDKFLSLYDNSAKSQEFLSELKIVGGFSESFIEDFTWNNSIRLIREWVSNGAP